MKSSTFRVPRTTVPAAPVGVIVTLTVTVWPGLTTTGENVVVGSMDVSHASPVSDVTAGSNAFVTADSEIVAVPAAAPLAGYGPHSVGPALQPPAGTAPPGGA